MNPVSRIQNQTRVQLTGKNFEPDWGLFNGLQGTIREIVCKDNKSPLEYNFPLYIIVDFPTYCGPSWIKNKPTWVPIPPIEITCKKQCCKFPYSIRKGHSIHTKIGIKECNAPFIKWLPLCSSLELGRCFHIFCFFVLRLLCHEVTIG
jgi:hypothetical protein